jgi:hypothetical protein
MTARARFGHVDDDHLAFEHAVLAPAARPILVHLAGGRARRGFDLLATSNSTVFERHFICRRSL